MAESLAGAFKALGADGKTTIEGSLTWAEEARAYGAAKLICADIAAFLADHVKAGKVVIVDLAFLSDLANLHAARLALAGLVAEFEAFSDHAAPLVRTRGPHVASQLVAERTIALPMSGSLSAVVPPAIETALGVVGLFREDVTYKGEAIAIDPLAFAIELASCLKQLEKGHALHVYIPALIAVSQAVVPDGLNDTFGRVEQARSRAWAVVAPLATELLTSEAHLEMAVAGGQHASISGASAELRRLNAANQPITSAFSNADKRLAELQSQWATADPKSGLTALSRMLRAEAIVALEPTFVLAEPVSSGGHTRVTKGFFRNLLFSDDGLQIAGGVIVRWALLDKSGALLAGDVVAKESGKIIPCR